MSEYDFIIVGSDFAGSMTTLNFLETCEKTNKSGRVALIEAGRSDERYSASRRTIAYLRPDKDLALDKDWKHEMKAVSRGEADQEYCEKLG
jgi:choline dehydrogenase-like flavoprotein